MSLTKALLKQYIWLHRQVQRCPNEHNIMITEKTCIAHLIHMCY